MIEPRLKPIFQKGFARTGRLLLKKTFNGLYLDQESAFGGSKPWPRPEGGLFYFSTHSSWWEPIVAAELCVNQQGLRTLAPMDEREFSRLRSLRYTGIFGVGPGDGPETEKLLAREFSEHPDTCVWVTPQGHFWPNEKAQPPFKSGLSRWSNRQGTLRVPVVLHYAFAREMKPGVFVRIGPALAGGNGLSVEEDSTLLREALCSQTRSLLRQVADRASAGPATPDPFTELLS